LISWNKIKARLLDSEIIAFDLLFFFTIIYLLGTLQIPFYLKITGVLCGVIVFFIDEKRQKSIYLWMIFLLLLLIELVINYFKVANHHFLLFYLTSISILHLLQLIDFKSFISNIKMITVIVLGAAALQKLFSPQFISGDYYYYMFNNGGFFRLFLNDETQLTNLIKQNWDSIGSLKSINPTISNSVTINNVFPHIKTIALYFSWAAILVEAIVAFVLFVKPKSNFTHLLFIALIIGISIFRLETGFLSILSISGYLLTDNLKFKMVYFFLIGVFISLIYSGVGYF